MIPPDCGRRWNTVSTHDSHPAELEGCRVPDAFLYEARDYANRRIDAATLDRRVRARYGLAEQ